MARKNPAAAPAAVVSDSPGFMAEAETRLQNGESPVAVFEPAPKDAKHFETRAECVRRLNALLSTRAGKYAADNGLLDPAGNLALPEGYVVDPLALRMYQDFKDAERFRLSKADGYAPGAFPVHTARAETLGLRKLPETDPAVAAWRGELDARPRSSGGAKGEPKFETVETVHGKFRKGSITHEVYVMLTEPAVGDEPVGYTKKEMVDRLVSMFPNSKPESLVANVDFQLTEFKKKLTGWTCGRDDAGRYSHHIEGVSKTRATTPEISALKVEQERVKAELREQRHSATATMHATKAKLAAMRERKSADEVQAAFDAAYAAKLEELRAPKPPRETGATPAGFTLETAPGVTETFATEEERDAAKSALEKEDAKKDARADSRVRQGPAPRRTAKKK